MNKHIEKALLQCQTWTNETGNEYGIALNRKGETVFEAEGDKTGITMVPRQTAFLEQFNTTTFVHSHPNNSCLSIQDLGCGHHFDLDIYAITPRGDVFNAKEIDNFRLLETAYYGEHDIYQKIKKYSDPAPKILDLLNSLQIHRIWERCSDKEHWMKYQTMLTADTKKDIELIDMVVAPYRCRY